MQFVKVVLSILIAWAVSAIVTAAGGFEEGSPARTDTRLDVLNEAEWIRIPYPGKYLNFYHHANLGILKRFDTFFQALYLFFKDYLVK